MFLTPKTKVVTVILKEVLKVAREERGLGYEELAKAVCLKKWHIREIEEAESFSTFYTMNIKIQAAKKIGNYLGLSEDQFLSSSESIG
jgi:ribosome-binding protein aMBF1 (putative translation factor)